jgi:hypothetical protein
LVRAFLPFAFVFFDKVIDPDELVDLLIQDPLECGVPCQIRLHPTYFNVRPFRESGTVCRDNHVVADNAFSDLGWHGRLLVSTTGCPP